MDLMNLITGGAQPLVDDNSIGARSDPSQSGPTMNPNLEALLRAIAMQKMQQEPPQQGWPEAAPAAGFQPGGAPQMMPNLADMPGPGPAPAAPVAQVPNDGAWPTDFGGRARSPNDIPMPSVDPRKAMTDGSSQGRVIMRPDAPPDFPIGAPMQPQPSMQGMIPSPQERALKNAASAFGAGIAKMPGNTKMSAFGRGMGGSIAGGDAAEKQDFDESAKALEAVRKAAASGDESAYKSALAQYYQAYAAKMRAEIGPDGQKLSSAKSSWQERMRDDLVERFKRENDGKEPTLEQLTILMKDPNMQRKYQQQLELADIRESGALARSQARTDSANFNRTAPAVDERFKQNRGIVTGNRPQAPAAPQASANREQPVGQNRPPAEIDFGGGGSQADPYKPMTREQFMQIPPGAFYLNPKTGTVDVKKAD